MKHRTPFGGWLIWSVAIAAAGFLQVLQVEAASGRGFVFPRSAPEETGVSSEKLRQYVEELDTKIDGLHSVMIVRRGRVIAEGWWTPYSAESRHTMYSLSKSFAATAVGIAQAEGKLSVDDTVVSFFPDRVPADASANLKGMRIRDLLAMSTGHHNEDIARFAYDSADAVKNFLALPVAHKPGTHFVYNTPASFMLSAIVHQVVGQSVLEYLGPRLFEPLGIENPKWDAGQSGISLGGFGLHIRTEDIARFGQLYLQNGEWQGKQLLTKAWVEAASARQTSNGSNPKSDWDQGYGYQFWRSRHGAFRGDGAFGQYCVVMPDEETVLAITSGVRDMQSVLNLTWDKLLPALRESSGPAALAKNAAAERALKEKLSTLKLRPIDGAEPGEVAARVTGKKFLFPANDQKIESIRIERGSGATVLVAQVNGREQRLECAPGAWRKGGFPYGPFGGLDLPQDQPVAVSGAWHGDILTAKIAFTETPYVLTLKLSFSQDQVTLDPEFNVAFGPVKRPQLIGSAVRTE